MRPGMPHVGVICAYNPGNDGMSTVDRAARQFFAHLGVPATFIHLQRNRTEFFKPYRLVRKVDDLRAFSHVIYWGDFQNNPLYGATDFCSREIRWRRSDDESQAMEFWRRMSLDLPGLLGPDVPVASIGNCFLGCEAYASDPAMVESFRRFTGETRLIVPREHQSVLALGSLAGESRPGNVIAGLDAAFLGTWGELGAGGPNYFAYCCARSDVDLRSEDLGAIEAATGLPARPLGWRSSGISPVPTLRHKVSLIGRAAFVLTDYFHVCVNALNLGVPVICISRVGGAMRGTLSDAKKRAMLDRVGATSMLVEVDEGETISDRIDEVVADASRISGGATELPPVERAIEEGRECMTSALHSFLGLDVDCSAQSFRR